MKTLINKYSFGKVLQERSTECLAKTIKSMEFINYKKKLNDAKEELNWSIEKEKLTSIFIRLDK